MKRQLVLVRHAKSAYPTGVDDHERPLSERGERDALVAGPVLAKLLPQPDHTLVSTATRAQQTWSLVAPAWAPPPSHHDEPKIYEAYVGDLMLLVREVDADVQRLLLVGHNPGFEMLATVLASERSDPVAIREMEKKFPTCAIAAFEIDQPWPELDEGDGRLVAFEVPRG
ncbi:MAG: histidine phosphatase family protein [Candidatus Nanopelagicales bacterium]